MSKTLKERAKRVWIDSRKKKKKILTKYECVAVFTSTQGKSECTVCDHVSLIPAGYIKPKYPIVPLLRNIPRKSPRKRVCTKYSISFKCG